MLVASWQESYLSRGGVHVFSNFHGLHPSLVVKSSNELTLQQTVFWSGGGQIAKVNVESVHLVTPMHWSLDSAIWLI